MKLLALDFDGVIAQSAPECFRVGLRTFVALRPESALAARARGPELYRAFLDLMPLGNRAEDYGTAFAAIDAGADVPDQEAYDAFKASLGEPWLRDFHRRFYRERHAWAEADPEDWLAHMQPYPRIGEILRRRAGEVILAIATSKDRRSVRRLLEAWGMADLFAEERILDKEAGASKRLHMERLAAECGVALAEITFVDDKVNHLEAVAPLGVRCVLAAWGYNGERERRIARAKGYAICSLEDLEARLFG